MMRFILPFVVIIHSTICCFANQAPYVFKDVGLTTTVNTIINSDLILTDEYDKNVNLRDLVADKPTIINFVYLNCPLLCHLLLDGLNDVINQSSYKANKDFQIISISIDPNEKNENLKAYKKKYLKELGTSDGWLFLKGSEKQIKAVTDQFGYHFKKISRTNDYSHPSAIFFYNKKITNYLEGVTFDIKSFNYSLMSGKVNKTIKEKFITYCYYYDPDSQTYSFLIIKVLRLLCLITVGILSILIITFIRRERRQK